MNKDNEVKPDAQDQNHPKEKVDVEQARELWFSMPRRERRRVEAEIRRKAKRAGQK